MGLNVGLDLSFDNMQNSKELRYKAKKFSGTKVYTCLTIEFLTGVILVSKHLNRVDSVIYSLNTACK